MFNHVEGFYARGSINYLRLCGSVKAGCIWHVAI